MSIRSTWFVIKRYFKKVKLYSHKISIQKSFIFNNLFCLSHSLNNDWFVKVPWSLHNRYNTLKLRRFIIINYRYELIVRSIPLYLYSVQQSGILTVFNITLILSRIKVLRIVIWKNFSVKRMKIEVVRSYKIT